MKTKNISDFAHFEAGLLSDIFPTNFSLLTKKTLWTRSAT
jgi:hypothetical protein